jgi:hypothetical protein
MEKSKQKGSNNPVNPTIFLRSVITVGNNVLSPRDENSK